MSRNIQRTWNQTKLNLFLEQLEDRNLFSINPLTFDNLTINPQQYDPHHVIVGLKSGAVLSALSPLASVARLESPLDLGDGMFRLELQPGLTPEAAVGYFRLVSAVRFVQYDYQVSLTASPNDPSFSQEWGLRNTGQSGGLSGADINATTAWNTTTGTGRTIVAVIDTGVDYNHPDLAANIWVNTREVPGNGRDDDGNGFIDDVRGWDFHNNDNNPMDDHGHGTHVAGIIGAVGNNGIGISGVNWRVQIMPVKFLSGSGSGYMSNAIRALNYAVANGAVISNNSYGGGGFYQAFYDAINNARARGHIFVAAAGNNSANSDTTPQYPASYGLDNVVSVAATDHHDRMASFSNYGARSVDLGAPGVNIYSTLPNNRYGNLSGTSMAAPFVAGAIALVRDLHPTWTYRQVIQQVLSTTDSLASLSGKTVTGGRLDIGRAIGGAGSPTRGPSVSSAAFSGAASGAFDRLRVTFDKAMNASSFTAADIVSFTRNGTAITGLTYTITPVAGSNNQFDITFATQTAAGTYQLTFGPSILDASGNAMDQNGNGVAGESPGDRFTATGAISAIATFNSTDAPKTIADARRTVSALNVGQDLRIDRLVVKLNISHTYVSDLRIYLRAPDGAAVTLFDRRGGSGDNIYAAFEDGASTAIASGRAPFSGSFRPEQSLAAFNGKNARGQWQLIIDDVAYYDAGRLNSWSITVETGAGGASKRSLEDESWTNAAIPAKAPLLVTLAATPASPSWHGVALHQSADANLPNRVDEDDSPVRAAAMADWMSDSYFMAASASAADAATELVGFDSDHSIEDSSDPEAVDMFEVDANAKE